MIGTGDPGCRRSGRSVSMSQNWYFRSTASMRQATCSFAARSSADMCWLPPEAATMRLGPRRLSRRRQLGRLELRKQVVIVACVAAKWCTLFNWPLFDRAKSTAETVAEGIEDRPALITPLETQSATMTCRAIATGAAHEMERRLDLPGDPRTGGCHLYIAPTRFVAKGRFRENRGRLRDFYTTPPNNTRIAVSAPASSTNNDLR